MRITSLGALMLCAFVLMPASSSAYFVERTPTSQLDALISRENTDDKIQNALKFARIRSIDSSSVRPDVKMRKYISKVAHKAADEVVEASEESDEVTSLRKIIREEFKDRYGKAMTREEIMERRNLVERELERRLMMKKREAAKAMKEVAVEKKAVKHELRSRFGVIRRSAPTYKTANRIHASVETSSSNAETVSPERPTYKQGLSRNPAVGRRLIMNRLKNM